jgi:hypothetical protein
MRLSATEPGNQDRTMEWTAETEEREDEQEADVARWRLEQYEQLGFDGLEAQVLADSEADLNQARSLLKASCSHELAIRILL